MRDVVTSKLGVVGVNHGPRIMRGVVTSKLGVVGITHGPRIMRGVVTSKLGVVGITHGPRIMRDVVTSKLGVVGITYGPRIMRDVVTHPSTSIESIASNIQLNFVMSKWSGPRKILRHRNGSTKPNGHYGEPTFLPKYQF